MYVPKCDYNVKVMNFTFKYNNKKMSRQSALKIDYKYLKILKLFTIKYKYEIGGEIKFEEDDSVNCLTLQTSFKRDTVKINLNKKIIYHTHPDVVSHIQNYVSFFRASLFLLNHNNLDIIKKNPNLLEEYKKIIEMSKCLSTIFIEFIDIILQNKKEIDFIKEKWKNNTNYLIQTPSKILKKIIKWVESEKKDRVKENIRQKILNLIFSTCPIIEYIYSPPSYNDILVVCEGAIRNSFHKSPDNLEVSIVVTRKGIFKISYNLDEFLKINKKTYDLCKSTHIKYSDLKNCFMSILSPKIKELELNNINNILSGIVTPDEYFKKIYNLVGIKIIFRDWNYIKISGLSIY